MKRLMYANNEHIDTKQLCAIIFVLMMSMKMFMVPALIIKEAGRDSYFTMAIFMAIETVTLAVALVAIKYSELDLYTLLSETYGKVLTKILLVVLIAYHLLKLALIISEVKVFFLFSANEDINWKIYVLPIFIFLTAVGVKTLRGIGRLTQIILPFIAVSIVLLFVLIVGEVKFDNIFPILADGPDGVFKALRTYPVWFGDLPMIAFCCGKVKRGKHMILKSLTASTLAAVVVMFFTTVIFVTYAYTNRLMDYGHNISNMVVYAAGNYMYGRFDLLIFTLWLGSLFIQMAYIFYISVRHTSFVFNYKNNFVIGLILSFISYALVIWIFDSELKLYQFCVGVPRYFTLVSAIVIPLMIMIAAIANYRKTKKNPDKGNGGNESERSAAKEVAGEPQ